MAVGSNSGTRVSLGNWAHLPSLSNQDTGWVTNGHEPRQSPEKDKGSAWLSCFPLGVTELASHGSDRGSFSTDEQASCPGLPASPPV